MAAVVEEAHVHDEAIDQVGEVVEMALKNGPKQPKLREMAAEFFLGVSSSERGRRELVAKGAMKVLLQWTGDMESIAINAFGALVNLR